MGSDSDLPTMQATLDTLTMLGVAWEVKITSAHRTPANTMEYVKSAEERGCRVFVAAAGLAAHLAGAVAAHTTCPVIGVPMEGGPLNGFDALLIDGTDAWRHPGGMRDHRQGRRKKRRLSRRANPALNDLALAQMLKDERAANTAQISPRIRPCRKSSRVKERCRPDSRSAFFAPCGASHFDPWAD